MLGLPDPVLKPKPKDAPVPKTTEEKIKEKATGSPSGTTKITQQVVEKTVKEDISSIPFEEEQKTPEIVQTNIDRFKQQGITPDTIRNYEYVEVGGRRFYGNDPYAWNDMIDYTSGLSVKTQIFAQRVERRRYEDTGEVPEYVRRQIQYEEGSKFKPLEPEIERLAYEKSLGIISEEQAQEQFTEAYYKQYPIVQPEPPKERDVWNISDWTEDFLGTAGGLAADVFMPLDKRIDFALSSLRESGDNTLFSGSGTEKMKDIWRENRQIYRQYYESGDVVKGGIRILSSPFPAVIAGYGIGAAFTTGFALVGGSAAPGSAAFAAYGPYISGGVVSGTIGADIGLTAAREEAGLEPEGKTIGKIGTYGVVGYSAYLGSTAVAGYRPTEAIGRDPYGNVYYRQYLTSFRGKPIIPLSKQIGLGSTPSGGIARIVSPTPSRGRIQYDIYGGSGFRKGTPTWGKTPSWEPDLGIGPTSIYDIKPIGPQRGTVVKYGNKIFYDTGKFWQPYSKPLYPLSTKVLPKPKVYRAYETHYFFLTYIPKPKPIISIKPKIDIKPFEPVNKTAKDIIKSDKQLEKELGIGKDSGQGLKTIQKTKLETKQILKTEKLVVPEQLLKTKVKYKTVQLQKLKLTTKQKLQPFSKLDQAYKIGLKQKQIKATKMLYGIKLDQKQAQAQKTKQDYLLAQKQSLDFKKVPITVSISKMLQGQVQQQAYTPKYFYDLKLSTPKIQYPKIITVIEKDILKPWFIPEEPPVTPKKPKTFRLPDLPFGDVEKPKVMEEPGIGYNVMVKDRYIVKGKKKYTERFIKLNRRPLSKQDALSFGGTVVDNSAAASFKITKAGKPAQDPSIPVRNFDMMQNMFYKRNDTFIEHTDYRINTPGEINQISARGWVADKRKLHPLPRKSKPMRVIKRRPIKDVFNKDMMKMFRGDIFG